MAYSAIPKSSSYFNPKIYTGTGSSLALTGVGFQPDWTWIKNRSANDGHHLYDAVRGVQKRIRSDTTAAQATTPQGLTAFGTDGFTVGTEEDVNTNGENFASWNWKANGSGSANSDGSIYSTVSVDTTSGFSIVSYTGNGTLGATVGHGLGQTPGLFVTKRLSGTSSWGMYHQSTGAGGFMELNSNNALQSNAAYFNNTAPTSSVFSIGTDSINNTSGSTYIGYCFAEKQGYSKFGKYTGNGNADGTFTYLGFKPAFVMIKRYDSGSLDWNMYDNKRLGYNGGDAPLFANLNNSESNDYGRIDFLSNGFKIRTSNDQLANDGGSFLYMAFGQPVVSTNGDIATAR